MVPIVKPYGNHKIIPMVLLQIKPKNYGSYS